MDNNRYDVIVVGAGASGLMAAIGAARAGATAAVLDHHTLPGKKILSTGNGKCNFTNQMQGSGCYRCDDPAFVLRILEQFPVSDTLKFFEELGVPAKQRQGYYYPRSGQASAIRDALLAELLRLSVPVLSRTETGRIRREGALFEVQTASGVFEARACVLATGGKAFPKSGSDGSGYSFAQRFGHRLRRPLPALVPLIGKDPALKKTAGVRCDAAVTLLIDGKAVAQDSGEVQMTAYGLSGIPVFQVSRYASAALAEGKDVTAVLDFFPEYSEKKLAGYLADRLRRCGPETWEQFLGGMVNRKLAAMLCRRSGMDPQGRIPDPKKIQPADVRRLVRQCKAYAVPITGTGDFDQAQATCGGVPVDEIGADDMQSKLIPGLFFAGEMVDVDGICGGYNLQWAWSSGHVAGVHAAGFSMQ